MEIIAAAFAAGIIVSYLERKELARLYPPQPCRYCPLGIRLIAGNWVHEDGRAWAEWPDMPAIPGRAMPLHPAMPSKSATLS